VKERFVECFKKLANARKFGNPIEKGVNHGPQADEIQYETVVKYIEIGKKGGGEILLGGGTNRDLGQNTVHPVIFADLPEDSQMMKEEVFGPVVVINTFKTEEEVIAKANDTEYGLYACLYTHNLERALRVSKKIESGMVGFNCASPIGSFDLPFGGIRASGTGRESLLESMDHFLEHKSIYFKVPGIGG
jgi:aldehyde dehydrogenase (NAD+)